MGLLCSGARSPNSIKGVRSFSTAGFLSSRLNCAQESVTTHLPNVRAPPTWQGLRACDWYSVVVVARCSDEEEGRRWRHLVAPGSTEKVHVAAASPFLPPCCRPLIPRCSFGAMSTQKKRECLCATHHRGGSDARRVRHLLPVSQFTPRINEESGCTPAVLSAELGLRGHCRCSGCGAHGGVAFTGLARVRADRWPGLW